MRRSTTFLLLLLIGSVVRAESLDLDELFKELNETILTNFDASSISELDDARIQELGRELQTEFQGEYVLSLAPVRETADAVLPVLEKNRDTHLAALLRAGVQALGTGNVLRVEIPAPTFELPRPLPVPDLCLPRPIWPARPRSANWPAGAQPYVRQLKPVFAQEGVPAELVWLAEVESGFQPQARSRAGAAGLFQLMPETAELLGLSLRPTDDRYVPMKSARAAAQYLKYLYEKFSDWSLALAAYNAGEGRVRRLLDQSRSQTYEAIAGRLPAETQLYVSKVEATLLRREGLALGELRLAEK
jgi:membrane-bound lytic murein transglycosylase D